MNKNEREQAHFHPLRQQPEATTVTVKRLVEKVLAGMVRVPVFQRPLRWRAEDVAQLFDSLWRGYPVGSLLFWKRLAEAGTIQLGGASLSVGEQIAWWLVDGQQRTVALALSLSELDHGMDPRWTIFFDPEAGAFVAGPVAPHRVGTDIPLSVLGDLRRLGRWIREHAPPDALVAAAEEAQQRILDYAIPVYVVETDEEGPLRAAFARLNSTGARMRADEVFQALLGAPSSARRPTLDLDALQAVCDVDGFGQPPRPEVLKAVLSMSGIDPTHRPERLRDMTGLVDRATAEEALRATVDFLQRECHIPHVRLIPYPVVFVILARWFTQHPHTPQPLRIMLARWVWRSAVTGVHQRAEVSKLREQVRAIHGEDPSSSFDRLFAHLRGVSRTPWTLERFNLKNARSRVEVLALLARVPRDPSGKVSLNALMSNGRLARELIAPRHLAGLDAGAQALARTAANRVLLDALHTDLQSEILRWDEQEGDALASHLLDEEALAALRRQDYAALLRRRSSALTREVFEFVTLRGGWNEPDLRPRNSYFGEEE